MSDTVTAPDSGTPAPSSTPATTPQAPAAAAPATPPAAPPASATIPQGAPSVPQTPATGDQGPAGWVPPYRLREVREQAERQAREQMAAFQSQYQSEIQQLRQQLGALVGVQQPQNPEVQAVRTQFAQLYPGLAQLEERAAELQALTERAQDFEASTSHQWTMYGRTVMDKIYSQAEKALGAPLNDEGKRALHSAFTGFVQSSPELTARYAQDPTLADEWFQSFSSAFISPAQRAASATVAGRAAAVQNLPNLTGGAVPPVSQPPKPKDMDERAAQAWTQFQQNRG